MSCTDNIIGLSQTTCNCYDTGKPVDYNTSKSGLFLDEIPGLELHMMKAVDDCATGNLWDRMSRSITNGLEQLTTELLACVQLNHTEQRKRFVGDIGQKSYTQIDTIAETYAGIKFTVDYGSIKGGKLKIKTIGTFMNATTTITMYLYSNESTTPLQSWVVNATALSFTANDVADIEVPLESDICDDLEYYLIYEVGENDPFQPIINKTDCGCNKDTLRQREAFASVDGIIGSDLTTMDEWQSRASAHGLIVGIEFWCATAELICKDEIDFTNDPWGKVLAHALRYKAGELLIEDILSSGEVNRYTMLDKERLWGKRNHYRKEYGSRVEWLCQEIDITDNDCLFCDDRRMNMGTLRS